MRIAFFGLPLAALLLRRDGHEIALAVLSPVEAPGRRRLRRAIGETRILAAGELGLELESQVDAALAALGADLVVSWYWTRRLPRRWLAAGRLGAIGVHPSLLPRHRGPNPFFWTIDSGDQECGVSVHRLTERYDEGAVLLRISMPTGERNAWQLARALDRPSLSALRQTVADLAEGRAPNEEPQEPTLATWAPEPEGDALRADFRWPTERVLRRIRALTPVPGLALEICGERFFVTRAEATSVALPHLEPGEAAALGSPPSDVVIRTADGAIRILGAVASADSEAEEAQILPLDELAQLVASRTRAVVD